MKSLTEISIKKSRIGYYKDNSENRRKHRVGARYGQHDAKIDNGNPGPSSEKIKEWEARAAALKARGIDPKICSSIEEYAGDPARQALREKLIEAVVEKAIKRGSVGRAIFALGGAASGKSSSLATLGYTKESIPCQINPDDFQEAEFLEDNMFYNYMDPKSGATRLHKETSDMTKEVYKRVLARRGDFVKDGVMGEYEKSVEQIEQARAAGYEPRVVGVTVDVAEAIVRSEDRFNRAEADKEFSGRWVPRDVMVEGHEGCVGTFLRLYTEYGLKDMVLFDNNVARGEKPVLIFDSKKKPPVLDKERMRRFLAKGGLEHKLSSLMEIKNDLVKSVESNNVGHSIHTILEKYWFQRNGETVPSGEPWAESKAQAERYRKAYEWANDGKPTGIKNDEEFYRIQKRVYGKVIMNIK